jgi:large subunit ribosomal protein L19
MTDSTLSKTTLAELRPGMTVKVHQKIKEKNAKGEEKERIQIFEGIILKHRHGGETGNTITVRKVSDGVGVEKIYPVNSPVIEKIEVVRQARVRRANLNYLRTYKKRLKDVK